MENIDTYFTKGKIVAQSGDVRVYSMDDQLFLEIGPAHDLWALESEVTDYIEQLNDAPNGNCLEIGLGLGVASRCILTYPKVIHLTTIEKNENVIKTHKKIIPILGKKTDKWEKYKESSHTIINSDGISFLYTTKEKYDFIFLDFYKCIDEDSLPEIADMINAASKCLANNGVIRGWFDPHTPKEFVKMFYELFYT